MLSNPRNDRAARARAENHNDADDSGEFLWPLTSSGAEGVRVGAGERGALRRSGAYPSVPQTLCEAEPDRGSCVGLVAEPLN